MADLQHRDDSKLEVIPDLERGTTGSVIEEKEIQPWQVVYHNELANPEDILDQVAKEVAAPLEEKLDLLDGHKFDPNTDTNQSHLDQVTRDWQAYQKKLNAQAPTELTITQPTKPKETRKKVTKLNLPVKLFRQWDSETNEGGRMCASSVMSMAIHYLSPGLITPDMLKAAKLSQLDDYYLKELVEANGGNTNDPDFHIKVLTALGFRASLVKNGSWALIDQQLHDGIPVPMVIAHHGPASSPDLSRWHWILCRGRSEDPRSKAHIYNDPNGELDNANGGYPQVGDGASMQYSDKNLTPRWQTDGPNQGWCVIVKRPFPVALKGKAPAPAAKSPIEKSAATKDKTVKPAK